MKYMKKILLGVLVSLFIPTIAKAESLKVGDYVYMKPTKTSYTIPTSLTGYNSDQTINPSELTLWRIIDIKSDGSFDAVSEYTSSTAVYFTGIDGFAKYVGTLQTIASQYQNSEYTIGSRMIGYNGQTLNINNTSAFDGSISTAPSTTTTPTPTSGTGEEYSGGVTGDTLYLKDYELVSNVYKTDTNTYGVTGLKAYGVNSTSTNGYYYWVASRFYEYFNSLNWFEFGGRAISTSSIIVDTSFRIYSNNKWGNSINNVYGGIRVRPILTFKPEVYIKSGLGTKDSPYALTLEKPKVCPTINTSDFKMEIESTLDYKKELKNDDLNITIEDTNVAEVDSNGVITAKKVGTTKVTISIEECTSKTVNLTVTNKETEEKEEITEETKVNEDTRAVETEKNPKTGNQKYYVFGLVLIITSILIYIVIKKKNILN